MAMPKIVFMPEGDLILCTGCRLRCVDAAWGMYQLILETPRKFMIVVQDEYWAGKEGPTEEIKGVRDEIVRQLVNPRTKSVDLRKNKTLKRLLKKQK